MSWVQDWQRYKRIPDQSSLKLGKKKIMQPFRQKHRSSDFSLPPLTSMMVHCSTTMASYVGVVTFGSPSLASWKMKTLSTDLGSKSAEKEEKKNPAVKKSIHWMECVCLVSAAALGPPGQRKWNDISQPHSHTTLYYIASGVGHLYEQCALYSLCRETV